MVMGGGAYMSLDRSKLAVATTTVEAEAGDLSSNKTQPKTLGSDPTQSAYLAHIYESFCLETRWVVFNPKPITNFQTFI